MYNNNRNNKGFGREKNQSFNLIDNSKFGSAKSISYFGVALKLFVQILALIGGVVVVANFPSVFMNNFFVSIILMVVVFGLSFAMHKTIAEKPQLGIVLTVLYSFVLGLFYGDIIVVYGVLYPGVIVEALTALMGIVVATFFLYLTGLIRISNSFIRFLSLFGLGFVAFIGINSLLSLFGIGINIWTNNMSMLISLIALALGTGYLFADYKYIDELVKGRASKEYEWLASSILLSTLVYIFINLLRILSLFRGRD